MWASVCTHVRGRVIYLGRQVGCCEELIMVQQSGARPCLSLIMGFHSVVHRLSMEPRCIRGGMGFHTHTHTRTESGSFSEGTAHPHTQICATSDVLTHNHTPMWIQAPAITFKAYWEEGPPSSPPSPPHLDGPCCMQGLLSEIGSQFLSLRLPYLCLSQLPTDKIQ